MKHPDWQKILPRRNWCEVAPYAAENGEADPRADGALVQPAPLAQHSAHMCTACLCAARCSLVRPPRNAGGAAQVFTLRVEDPEKQEAPAETFPTIVPTYIHDATSAARCPVVCACMPTLTAALG